MVPAETERTVGAFHQLLRLVIKILSDRMLPRLEHGGGRQHPRLSNLSFSSVSSDHGVHLPQLGQIVEMGFVYDSEGLFATILRSGAGSRGANLTQPATLPDQCSGRSDVEL